MSDTPIPDECWTDINFVLAKCRQLGREVAELRKTTIEECAKVAEERIEVPHGDGSGTMMFSHHGNQAIARAIRAMKSKP